MTYQNDVNVLQYELSSRTDLFIQKNMKRIFEAQSIMSLDDDWLTNIKYIKNKVGFKSIPWLFLDEEPITHLVFGYIDNFQFGTYNAPLDVRNSLKIIEK